MKYRTFDFLTTWFPIWLGIGALAIGIKFPVYWDHWVYFPAVPNVLDTAWLILVSAWLISEGVINHRVDKALKNFIRGDESALSPIASTILMIVITIALAIVLYLMIVHLLPGA